MVASYPNLTEDSLQFVGLFDGGLIAATVETVAETVVVELL